MLEEKSVVAKVDQEKNGRSKARKKKELRNVEQILKSLNNLNSDEKLQVNCCNNLYVYFIKFNF